MGFNYTVFYTIDKHKSKNFGMNRNFGNLVSYNVQKFSASLRPSKGRPAMGRKASDKARKATSKRAQESKQGCFASLLLGNSLTRLEGEQGRGQDGDRHRVRAL